MSVGTEYKLPGLGPILDAHAWMAFVPGSPWLVSGLIAAESLTLITAKREVGKSLLVCDFLCSYATGEPEWLGREFHDETPRGRVLYMVTDANAEAEIARQVVNLGIPSGRVAVARHSGELGHASADDWARWGREQQERNGVKVLIVDNGTGMSAGVVDTEATSRLFKALRSVTGPLGLTVILVHHEKNTGGTAGNYQWQSESRHRLNLAMSDSSDYRVLSFEGGNTPLPPDMPTEIPLRMPRREHPSSRFTLSEARNVTPEQRSAERMDENDQLLSRLIALGRSDWGSQSEIAEALGTNQSKVSRMLKGTQHVLVGGSVVPRSLFIHSPPHTPPAE